MNQHEQPLQIRYVILSLWVRVLGNGGRQACCVFSCCTYMAINHARSLLLFFLFPEKRKARRQQTYGAAARADWTSASLQMSHNVSLLTGGQHTVRGSREQSINGTFAPYGCNVCLDLTLGSLC